MIALRKILSLIITIVLVASFAVPVHAQLLLPFGGAITTYLPGGCFGAPGQPIATAVQIGPPTFTPLMYMFGVSTSLKFGPPTHPGQWLLGMAGAYAPCMIWVSCGITICYVPNPLFLGGSIIIYHGSSGL
ncbi:hypothetical protein COB55_00645 [Candidatus Wolfebacteria bacterium]|nr:MAG: hypothetical protein COB55_00645 [Candidatus Wolfebacteria bacterium]